MAVGAVGGAIAGGLLGGVGQSSSTNNSYGYGTSSGSSWEQGGSTNTSSSSSYSKTYGSEASAKDIARAAEANAITEKWMNKNLDFQEYMSNTAYQRAVRDLIAAGLNPVLAAMNGGSSTPTGAMATSAKATTFPDTESYSESSSSGNSYNMGGSIQNGINLNVSSGKSSSRNTGMLQNIGESIAKGVQGLFGGAKGSTTNARGKGGSGGSW